MDRFTSCWDQRIPIPGTVMWVHLLYLTLEISLLYYYAFAEQRRLYATVASFCLAARFFVCRQRVLIGHWPNMEPSATRTMVAGLVWERLQAGTEDAPVLDRPAPLRRLHDSPAGYKYPDLLTYLLAQQRSSAGAERPSAAAALLGQSGHWPTCWWRRGLIASDRTDL